MYLYLIEFKPVTINNKANLYTQDVMLLNNCLPNFSYYLFLLTIVVLADYDKLFVGGMYNRTYV